jgi:hypothetical protein
VIGRGDINTATRHKQSIYHKWSQTAPRLHRNNIILSMIATSKTTALQCAYTFSFMRRGKGSSGDAGKKEDAAAPAEPKEVQHPYENAIKAIATVFSVEEFWAVYDFLKRPSDLTPTTDYQ